MARHGTAEAVWRRPGREGNPGRVVGGRGAGLPVTSNPEYGTGILFIHNATKFFFGSEIAEKDSAFTERDSILHVHDLEIGTDDRNPRNREVPWSTAIAWPDTCLRRKKGYIYQ
ncbi:hypothetical protein GCM10022252_47620 [Streptosporangium oxazolinicum]|uniref:Uncharacterized protein n=1 Tax=Streptosporangium oxazolinicum TaxID=909287 RepID=A0ABP8B4W3_9ACTN